MSPRRRQAAAITTQRLKAICLGFPGATANVQWGADLVFKVGGKMFAVTAAGGGAMSGLSFKTAPESFHILTQLPGIKPAPYLARAGWVALESLSTLPADELAVYLARAHALVTATLPKKVQATLATSRLAWVPTSYPAAGSACTPDRPSVLTCSAMWFLADEAARITSLTRLRTV